MNKLRLFTLITILALCVSPIFAEEQNENSEDTSKLFYRMILRKLELSARANIAAKKNDAPTYWGSSDPNPKLAFWVGKTPVFETTAEKSKREVFYSEKELQFVDIPVDAGKFNVICSDDGSVLNNKIFDIWLYSSDSKAEMRDEKGQITFYINYLGDRVDPKEVEVARKEGEIAKYHNITFEIREIFQTKEMPSVETPVETKSPKPSFWDRTKRWTKRKYHSLFKGKKAVSSEKEKSVPVDESEKNILEKVDEKIVESASEEKENSEEKQN